MDNIIQSGFIHMRSHPTIDIISVIYHSLKPKYVRKTKIIICIQRYENGCSLTITQKLLKKYEKIGASYTDALGHKLETIYT